MAYTFDPIFAADPSNPANVAANAAILIYDPNDAGKAPVTITDLTGSPLPNPVTVNKNGFGSAFQHATLDRLAWSGAGFEGFFTSYEGMKNVAIAAQEAAETAASTAAAEAAEGVAPVVAEAEAAADAAAAAQAAAASSATAAANSAALVGAPADTAIAAAINGSGATKAALSATIATATGGKADKTVLSALRRLASIPAPAAAFAQEASALPTITNTNSPNSTLSKTWAATLTGGPLAWSGPLAVRVANGGIGPDLPTGGPTPPGITWEWVTDEPLIAINAVFGNGSPHNIYVDDELITINGAIQGTNSHQVIDWSGVRKMRHYRLVSGEGFTMIGIKTTAAGTVIQPPVDARPLCAFFTDSYGMGSAAVGQLQTDIPGLVGRLLGWRMRSAADGGTGWVNPGVSGGSNVTSKISQLSTVKLDAAIFALGINDSTTGLQSAVTAALNQFAADHPGVPMYVVGPWQPSTTWRNANLARTAAVKDGAAAVSGTIYIDNDGWIFGTGKLGSRVVADGVTNATTTITSATAAFTSTDVGSFITGTGIPAGATIASVTNSTTAVLSAAATTTATGVSLTITNQKGDGNSDLYILSDATHPDPATGKPYLAVRVADGIKTTTANIVRNA